MLVYANNTLLKTYSISLGKILLETSNLKEITKHRKVLLLLMPRIPTVLAIKIWVFHIRITSIFIKLNNFINRQEEILKFTVYQIKNLIGENSTDLKIGRMAV